MAKHFTSSEKSVIQEELLEKGKDLFSRYGLKKTTISDLTGAVGIAKGTFYHFFDSKEILYFEIFLREERRLKNLAMETLQDIDTVTPEKFQKFLFESIIMVDKNPILKILFSKDDYEHLLRKLPQNYLDEHTKEDIEVLSPLLKQWQQRDILIDRDPDKIVGIIRALMLITMHRSELGEDQFEGIVLLMTELIAKGLIQEKQSTHG